MKIHYIRKKAGRKYESAAIIKEMMGEQLLYTELGSPYIDGVHKPYISITDTKKFWIVLLAGSPCGIDAEEPGRKITTGVVKRFHEREQRYLGGLSSGSFEWTGEFLSIWVRKEAYMKYCGQGMRMGFNRFSVLDEALEYASEIKAENYPSCFMQQLEGPSGLYLAAASEREEDIDEISLWPYEGKTEKHILDAAGELLSAKAYTASALTKKLLDKGYSSDETNACIERLKELGYLDDEAYAQSYVKMAAEKGHGKRRIAFDLMKKGADSKTAKAALEELAEDEDVLSERERAMEQAHKMLKPGTVLDEKMLNRIGRKLASLGYEAGVVYDVLGKLRR